MKSFKDIRTKLEEATLSPAQEKKREEIVKSLKKKKEEFVERYGEKWEEVMYATATKLAKEMTEETLVEEEEWVLGFEFDVDYTSKEGRAIQDDLHKKFKKIYSGSGSGGAGFDVSFDGPKKELEKAKKYVEKKYKRQIEPKYTNFYQYEGFEAREIDSVETVTFDLTEMSAVNEATKWKMGDGRPRGGARIENVRFWDLSKDELEYIIKDAGEAMRANPKARKATTGPGNWADQVNDASTVLAWRKKNGIKESVQIDEDEKTQRFFKGVHAELKKVMDDKYYREFRASNDGRALDNVINHFGKSRGFRVDKTVKSIIDKYGRNRDEYIKKSFEMAANTRRGFREEVEQIDEKNEPTNPALWKKAIAKAKAKFDVYPSAYANAWASKWYKEQGGGWKKVSEELEEAMSGDKLLGIFNKLKNKDTVEIKYDSGIRKGKDYQKFVVTSGKRTVGKARVERIIMKSVDNPHGVKYTLYNRKGNVSLAIGDMAASIVDIKESVELDEKVDGWIAIYNGKKLEIPNDGKVKGIYGAKQLAIKHFKVPKSKQGMLAISPATNESVELGEAKNPKLSKLSKDAKEVLASAINQSMEGVPGMDAPSATVKNLDKFTPDAIDAAIKFLDKNSKKMTPAGRHYAREIVRAMKESVSIDEFELEEKVVKGEAAPFVVKQRDGNYITHIQGKKIKYVGRELSKAKRFTKKDAEYFASRDRGSKVINTNESTNPEYDEELSKMNIGEGKAWDAITKVKDEHQNQKVHGMVVDAMTANLLHKVHDALNSTNQKKFVAAIDKNAAGLKKMVDFAYKQVK